MTSGPKVFVDATVLVHAHNRDAAGKRHLAARQLERLWAERTGVVSTKVLEEFYLLVTRGVPSPVARAQARDVLEVYAHWPVEPVGPDLIMAASQLEDEHRLSFRDALLAATARKAGAAIILSDRLPARPVPGVRVIDPFAGGDDEQE